MALVLQLGVCVALGARASAAAATPGLTYKVGDTEYAISWMDRAAMPIAVSDASASAVGSKVYIVGGCDSDKGNEKAGQFHACLDIAKHVMIYEPQLNTWGEGAVMPYERFRHAAAVVNDDIYVTGGRDVSDVIVKSVLKYSTAADAWTTVIPEFQHATSDNAAFSQGTKVYVCGGYDQNYATATSMCYVLDTAAANPEFTVLTATLGVGRGDFSMVKLGEFVYAIGGFDSAFTALSSVERLTLASFDRWTMLASGMRHGRGDFASVNFKGRILVMGGENGTDSMTAGAALQHVEAYSPVMGSWLTDEQIVAIPHHTFRFCGAVVGDSVYIFGGQGPLDPSCDCHPTKSATFAYTESTQVAVSKAPGLSLQPHGWAWFACYLICRVLTA